MHRSEAARPWILQSKLRQFLTLFLLLAIPTAIFTGLVTFHVRKQIKEQALQENAVITRIMARALDAQFIGRKKEVAGFATRLQLIQLVLANNRPVLRIKLNELLRISPSFSRAFATDPNGHFLADYPPSPNISDGTDFSNRDWFKGAVTQDDAYVSEVYNRTNVDNALVVTICTRIRDQNQKTIGYLGAQFTAADMLKWMDNLRPDRNSIGFILDQNGNPAVTSEKSAKLAQDPAFQKLKAASGSITLRDPAGREWYFNFERIPSSGWTIVSQMPTEVVIAPVRALLYTTAIFFVLSLIAMALIGWYWFQAFAHFEQQREKAEEELRVHATNLKRSNQELESLCYSIAHDLRAPLRAMRGFASALREEYSPSLDESGRDYVQRICDGAVRMDELTDALLSYGRLGHSEMPIVPIDLNIAVNLAVATFESEIRKIGACLEIKQPLPSVLGNDLALQQAVENLIGNALKFVKPGTVPQVAIWAEENDGKVLLKIKDNGIGIDPAHHKRIFGVFERLHPRSTYPGTGIGLAIVRKSVERLGGEFGLESKSGEGSCFWLSLPKAK